MENCKASISQLLLRPLLHYLSYVPVLPPDSWLSFLLGWLVGLGLAPAASHTATLSCLWNPLVANGALGCKP